MINTPDFHLVKEDLLSLLPQPCEIRMEPDNSAERYKFGDTPEVIVHLKPIEVQVYRCSYVWVESHTLLENPQLVGTVNWRDPDAGTVYRGLIKKGPGRETKDIPALLHHGSRARIQMCKSRQKRSDLLRRHGGHHGHRSRPLEDPDNSPRDNLCKKGAVRPIRSPPYQ